MRNAGSEIGGHLWANFKNDFSESFPVKRTLGQLLCNATSFLTPAPLTLRNLGILLVSSDKTFCKELHSSLSGLYKLKRHALDLYKVICYRWSTTPFETLQAVHTSSVSQL